MKIDVKSIPPEGLDVVESLDPAELGFSDLAVKCVSPLKVQAHIERVKNIILANTKVKATFEYFCARCLEPISREVTENYNFDYPVDPLKDSIELDEDIRQELILGFPMVVLCKEDCKGICQNCGENLNTNPCKCN